MPLTEYVIAAEKAPSRPQPPQRRDRPDAHIERLPPEIVRRIGRKDIARLTRQLATLLHAGMPLAPALSALAEVQAPTVSLSIRGRGLSRRPYGTGLRLGPVKPSDGKTASRPTLSHRSSRGSATTSMTASLFPLHSPNILIYSRTYSSTWWRPANQAAPWRTSSANWLRCLRQESVCRQNQGGNCLSPDDGGGGRRVVIFLLSFVVPSIAQIFLEMSRQLPWPTRLLISICSFMRAYWLLFPAVACGAFFAAAALLRTDRGRMAWDRSRLTLPLFGSLLLKLEIARVARTLGALLSSGVPILRALDIVKGVVGNRLVAAAISSVKDSIGRGINIAEAMRATGLFPPIVLHIIATGQICGGIEDGLMDIADMYDDEVEQTSKALVSLLEPAILLVMGAVVGFIVLAILLPIFDINQAI